MSGSQPEGRRSQESSKADDPHRTVASQHAPFLDSSPEHPQQIGRYRIEQLLGSGGFGHVFLAYDTQLKRTVAIKTPHASLLSRPEDARAYLLEAQTLASLDHPSIVPVYDVGSGEGLPCYVVSKYIEGTDLGHRIRQQRLVHGEAARLVSTIAEALHYAHMHGNALERCQDVMDNYVVSIDNLPMLDRVDTSVVTDAAFRVLRGADFYAPAEHQRSARRYRYAPQNRVSTIGIRLVRTLPPARDDDAAEQ